MNIEITVIDDSDAVGWFASATRLGEIYMSSVSTKVENVKKKVGNKNGIQIGND